jgi:hypothetical protein
MILSGVNLAIATDQKADIGGHAAQRPTISNTVNDQFE